MTVQSAGKHSTDCREYCTPNFSVNLFFNDWRTTKYILDHSKSVVIVRNLDWSKEEMNDNFASFASKVLLIII